MGFRKVLLVPLVVAAACGGSAPASPSGPTLGGGIPFQVNTRYSLTMVGNTISCGDAGSPKSGTTVTLDVMMVPDTTGWTATAATAAAGTLSLRFEQGPVALAPAVSLAGTLRGFADDQGATGTRVTFGATGTEAVALSGSFLLQVAQGIFGGTVIFSRNGVTSTCPGGTVNWTLRQPPG